MMVKDSPIDGVKPSEALRVLPAKVTSTHGIELAVATGARVRPV